MDIIVLLTDVLATLPESAILGHETVVSCRVHVRSWSGTSRRGNVELQQKGDT